MRQNYDRAELDDLKERNPLSGVFSSLGYKVKGGKIGWTVCPLHKEKTASCQIDDRRWRWKCFGCSEGGDHFDILMLVRGLTFPQAVEALGGTRKLNDGERKKIDDQRRRIDEEDERERQKQRRRIVSWWDTFLRTEGTLAERYLAGRYLEPDPSWTFDLRFCPSMAYRGYASLSSDEQEHLGLYPAMVAAIRDSSMDIIGLHRTYLDPLEVGKLSPPGDRERNKSKKVFGEQRGGLIWLSAPMPKMAIGEGIETTRSWPLLMKEKLDGSCGIAAGVSLGNISGRSSGTQPHPSARRKFVSNGMPNLDVPGIIFPDEVKEIVFLMDGDSDSATTRQLMLCASRRAAYQDKVPTISVADEGLDFNSMLGRDRSAGVSK